MELMIGGSLTDVLGKNVDFKVTYKTQHPIEIEIEIAYMSRF